MKRFYERIKGLLVNDFVKSVAVVTSGTALSQIITIIFYPVITRLFDPAAFGLSGAFVSLMAILAPVVALSFPIAIVLPKSDLEASAIAQLSLRTALIISIFIAILLLGGGNAFLRLLNLEPLSRIILIIPVYLLLSAFGQVAEQSLIRHRQFRLSARVSILQSLFGGSAKSIMGLLRPVGTSLVWVITVAEAVRALLLWLGTRGVRKSISLRNKSALSLRHIAKKYKEFPLFQAPEITISAVATGLPVLFLTGFFGPASAGFYTLGKKVMGIPSTLISKSVGDVFYPHITKAAHEGKPICIRIIKSTVSLAAVGIIPYGLVVVLGPWLFSLVFGAEWEIAGAYTRWLAIWLYFSFLNRPCIKSLPVLKAQRFHLLYSIIVVILRILCLATGYYLYNSDTVAIALYSISGAITNIILIIIVLFMAKKFDRDASASGCITT